MEGHPASTRFPLEDQEENSQADEEHRYLHLFFTYLLLEIAEIDV
jgi:hypothetical protein